jgi:hypothetical protein
LPVDAQWEVSSERSEIIFYIALAVLTIKAICARKTDGLYVLVEPAYVIVARKCASSKQNSGRFE